MRVIEKSEQVITASNECQKEKLRYKAVKKASEVQLEALCIAKQETMKQNCECVK